MGESFRSDFRLSDLSSRLKSSWNNTLNMFPNPTSFIDNIYKSDRNDFNQYFFYFIDFWWYRNNELLKRNGFNISYLSLSYFLIEGLGKREGYTFIHTKIEIHQMKTQLIIHHQNVYYHIRVYPCHVICASSFFSITQYYIFCLMICFPV